MSSAHKPPQRTRSGHMLPRYIIVGVLGSVVVAEALMLAGEVKLFGREFNLAAVLPGVVASLTNNARTDEKLLALTENEALTRGAQMKANDMAEKGYFSHTGPDGSPPWKWFREAGYTYQYAGENLAVNFNDSEDVVNAWLESPTHRANILRAQFTEIGIGIATGTYKGKKATFVVQFFGKPGTAMGDAQSAVGVRPQDLAISESVLGTTTGSIVEQFAASPATPEKQTFFILLGVVAALLVAGFVFGRRFPKLWPTIAVLLALAIALGFALEHQDVLLGVSVLES